MVFSKECVSHQIRHGTGLFAQRITWILLGSSYFLLALISYKPKLINFNGVFFADSRFAHWLKLGSFLPIDENSQGNKRFMTVL